MITARQYRKFLEALDISRARAGKMLGLDERTSRRYANDISRVPDPVNIVLRLMLKYKLTPDDIDELKQEKLL